MDTPNLAHRSASALAAQRAAQRTDTAGSSDNAAVSYAESASAQSGGAVLSLLDAAARRSLASARQHPGTATSGPDVDPEAQALVEGFQQQFSSVANDHDAFHALMRDSFGDTYDYAAAEQMRQQTLAGDFSWMPDVQVVDASELVDVSGTHSSGTALGAFSAETNTIYISSDVIENDPERASEIMAEEMGHAIDAQINTVDAAGDEGAIFAHLLAGNELSDAELDALRAENDSGTIVIDGQEIEVEYGCNPAKAIGDLVGAVVGVFSDVFNAVAGVFTVLVEAFTDFWEMVKDVAVKVLNSPIFQALLTIAQFIPIPIVQVVVRVVQIVKAVYAVAQGIKHGSLAMVLGGIAGAAGGIANVGGMLGASQSFINGAARVATWAGNAARAYQAISQRDFAAALALGSSAFSGTAVGNAFDIAGRAHGVAEAIDEGDVLGALQLGSNLVTDLNGGETPQLLETLNGHVGAVASIVQAAESGDYDAAASLLFSSYGDVIGLPPAAEQRVVKIAGALEIASGARDMIDDGNYAGAALALFASAEQFDLGDSARQHLENAATRVSQLFEVARLVERGDYGEAVALGAAIIDQDPSPQTEALVNRLVHGAERVEHALVAADRGEHATALALIADGLGAPLTAPQHAVLHALETRIDGAEALRRAVRDGDVGAALEALEVVTSVSLPQQFAAFVDGVDDASEQVAGIQEAIDTHQYIDASRDAARLADSFRLPHVATSLESLASLLERLGFQSIEQRAAVVST